MTDKDLIDMLRTKQVCTGFKPDGHGDVNVLYGPDPVTAEAADRIEALTAQLAEDADARALMDDRLEQLVAQVDALTAERDHAWEMAAKADTQMGQSLADNLQAKVDTARLREALGAFVAHYPKGINPDLDAACFAARAALKGETP